MDHPHDSQAAIDKVVKRLQGCQSLLFVTGAGVSADSGLPTYRGVGGLYDVDTTEEGFAIEEIVSGDMLEKNPELTWKYLRQIGEACRDATFNRAHQVLAEMERRFERVWVVTQNVDGFHRAAGSRNLIDLHGDLHDVICTACDFRRHVNDVRDWPLPPHCPRCTAMLRPDVVLFGEMLPGVKTDVLLRELNRGFDMVFTIGTSSLFDYITWPIRLAKAHGCCTVEINPGSTDLSDLVDIRIPLGAAAALGAIWDSYCQGDAARR